jgi:hypothetical protein
MRIETKWRIASWCFWIALVAQTVAIGIGVYQLGRSHRAEIERCQCAEAR